MSCPEAAINLLDFFRKSLLREVFLCLLKNKSDLSCFVYSVYLIFVSTNRNNTMKNETNNILRDTQGYKIEKVKRDISGSYAITKDGKKSSTQFNGGTVKTALLKMSDTEFIEFAKARLAE